MEKKGLRGARALFSPGVPASDCKHSARDMEIHWIIERARIDELVTILVAPNSHSIVPHR